MRRIITRITGWQPNYGVANLKGDLFGGVVSAVMMVPVALGFGALSDLSDENRRVLSAIDREFETLSPEDLA